MILDISKYILVTPTYSLKLQKLNKTILLTFWLRKSILQLLFVWKCGWVWPPNIIETLDKTLNLKDWMIRDR